MPTLTRPAFTVATQLIEKAAELFDVEPWDVPRLGGGRRGYLPRFAVVWVLREMNAEAVAVGQPAPYSYTKIGRLFGYADHTTGLYSYRQSVILRETNSEFRDLTDKLLAHARTLGPQVVAKAA